jgi:RNA recognition motif-containing protein
MISQEGPNNNNSRIIDSVNIERKYFNDITIPVVSAPENGCKIFIGQIPKDLKENDLRPFLDEFGSITDISIIRERDRDTGAFISKGDFQTHRSNFSYL